MESTETLVGGLLDILPEVFYSILPNEYNLYFYRRGDYYMIYISTFEDQLNNAKNTSIGHIKFVIDYDDSELNVQYVESKRKGQGIGHYLMIIIGYICTIYGIRTVTLEDCSKLAHQCNNIYKKLGCTYINEKPESEMECNPLVILNKYDEFYKKYKGKGFFI